MNTTATLKQNIAELLAENPMLLPAELAGELNVSEGDIVRQLPEDMVTLLDGMDTEEVFTELRTWGELMMVLDIDGSIFEMVTPFPKGGYKFGYYNMSDRHTPLKGHLKMDAFGTIALVSKPFHGVDTRSVQFYSPSGRCVMKFYLRRNKDKSFNPEQLEKFETLALYACAQAAA